LFDGLLIIWKLKKHFVAFFEQYFKKLLTAILFISVPLVVNGLLRWLFDLVPAIREWTSEFEIYAIFNLILQAVA